MKVLASRGRALRALSLVTLCTFLAKRRALALGQSVLDRMIGIDGHWAVVVIVLMDASSQTLN